MTKEQIEQNKKEIQKIIEEHACKSYNIITGLISKNDAKKIAEDIIKYLEL